MLNKEFAPPSARQKEFLTSERRYTAYGGARGGGKSWAVRVKAVLMCLRYPGFRALLLRRTLVDVRENHIVPLRSMLQGIAQFRETDRAFLFPNGSRLRFGYCDGEKDVEQYQGQEYDCVFIDEATQFSEYQFRVLSASVRGTNAHPKRVYLSCNPGGVGHAWVKRLFIDRDFRPGEDPRDYVFVKARVYDNAALMEENPEYIKMLQNLPDAVREAWLNGNWDAYEGQYFGEFQRETHVTEPPRDMTGWAKYAALDYGLDMLACLWVAVDSAGDAVVYKELYQPGLIVSRAAERILETNAGDDVELFIAPPDLWNRNRDTGESTAEIFSRHGIDLYKANNSRIQGWYALKEWLRVYDGAGVGKTAKLKIAKNCLNLIRCLPLLQHSEKDPNDVATEPHEITHAPDALRYFVSARPLPAVAMPDVSDESLLEDMQLSDLLSFGR